MKSLREWLSENNEFNSVALRNVMGGTTAKVDTKLKMMLRPKLEQMMKEFGDQNPMNLLRDIIAVSAAIIGDMQGTKISVDKIVDMVHSMPEGEEVD